MTRGSSGSAERVAVMPGAETYTSPHRVCPSQSTTVVRKLPTISPTPMVTETATMSAAMATAVRLSDAVTLRGASRPGGPKTAVRRSEHQRADEQRRERGQQRKPDGQEEQAGEADLQVTGAN